MLFWSLLSLVAVAGPKKKRRAEPEPPPVEAPAPVRMDNAGIDAFLTRVFGDAATDMRQSPNQWSFNIERFPVMIVTDEGADRMRIIIPITDTESLPQGFAERMLQANFDAVLDARYAIGQGTVWATFIHPLSPLTEAQLASGLAQTVTAAATFGTTFTSGALVFGGGDSSGIYEELLEKFKDPVDRQGI
ncbi:MAG: hypothetical protein AAGA48_26615 [Myxococcota bacterium]